MKKILFMLLAIAGFVACDSKEPSFEPKLQLLVDKAEIIANGEDCVTFLVKFDGKDVTADATIHFADSHEALEGNTFKTKYAGEYEFYAQYGSSKSEVWQVYAKEDNDAPDPGPEPQEKELKLSVEPATIYVDESATFKVEYDGNDVTADATIYLEEGDVALEGATYTATAEGNFTFYAKYEDVTSNKVMLNVNKKDEVEEKPIEITATELTIKANGVDSTKFTVTQDGANVTEKSTIYVDGSVLNGSRFITTTPGTYTVYAVKGEHKSNELTITAEEVTSTGKTIVFADGVTLTSGWYDVNKKAQGDNGDINMCWAATSSNMIQWFQDRYKATGKTLPAGAVDGPGVTTYTNYGPYELELMNVFLTQWDNSRGGHMEQAIPWYFEGVLNGGEYASPGSQAVPLTDGGFWKSIWSDVKANMYCGYDSTVGYTTCYNNYYQWGNGTDLLGAERLAYFTDLVVTAFEHGMAGLTISLSANLSSVHHATTLWGYEIDNATGLLTRVWITDSDDIMTEPKTPLLNEYNVSVDDGKSNIKLSGNTRYGACYVVSIHPFAGYGSAE
ncbi:MAG: IdeS/Mac family cysteine endopeptidase [Alistipes sp.]|nr:IdeS/Mac family cysteine endopeptidase [Alistipes sp.]